MNLAFHREGAIFREFDGDALSGRLFARIKIEARCLDVNVVEHGVVVLDMDDIPTLNCDFAREKHPPFLRNDEIALRPYGRNHEGTASDHEECRGFHVAIMNWSFFTLRGLRDFD